MRSAAIIAIAGALAVGAGLLAAVGTVHNDASTVLRASAPQNNALTPLTPLAPPSRQSTPSDSAAQSSPLSPPLALPTTSAIAAEAPNPLAPIPPGPVQSLGPTRRTLNGHPVVYLTFDDGPSLTHTQLILDTLARHHAKATFFVEGRNVRRYPQLITAELAAGDSVGNHTLSHPHLPTLSQASIRYQLTSTRDLLRALGANAQCVRPPFGETNALVHRVESALGMREYLWTTETKDWMHSSVALDLQRANAGLRPGAIIVFHDGRASGSTQSVAAVEQFLVRLEAQGYVALPLPC
jgi:peptidoglycan/xylan/chitin deacetylase (PgdA/CDA1 family)